MHKSLKSKGRKISYQITGKGSPLVFLHGFLENASMWKAVENTLNISYKIILIDLPGHGLSECNGNNEKMDDMADAVKTICIAENAINPIVFGHSMGGYVGLELSKILAIKLVLVHSNFWADSELKKRDRDRVVEVVKDNLSLFAKSAIPNLFYEENMETCYSEIQNLIAGASMMDVKAVVAATRGMRDRINNSEVISKCKVAIIQGANDPVISKREMKEQLNLLDHNVDYYEIENCGHMGFVEQPVQFLKMIKLIIDKFTPLMPNN